MFNTRGVGGGYYRKCMRLLHTSDWHVGRTFHGFDTTDHLRRTLEEVADLVVEHEVDVVLIAGDVFDLSTPAAHHFTLLTEALQGIRDAGAIIVATSGNHDSAARLGFLAPLVASSGTHILTEWPADPVVLEDEHGPVHVFGIPYLEPNALRVNHDDPSLGTADGTLRWAMRGVRSSLAANPARSVVLSHCFVGTTPTGETIEDDAPRDITVGGKSMVSAQHFSGVDYVALGHIHSRQRILDNVRYSGAPLHYSFGERSRERGGWLIDLGPAGVESIEWLGFTVERPLTTVTGNLDDLLVDDSLVGTEQHWVRAVLTDDRRPLEPMRRLRERWPHCAHVELRPRETEASHRSYRERVQRRTDLQVVEGFLRDVRQHEPMSTTELSIITEAMTLLQQKAES